MVETVNHHLKLVAILAVIIVCVVTALSVIGMTGAGGFERHFTLSGIYAVVRPNGYDAICFVDADSKQGGVMCLPCSTVKNCEKVQ